MENLQLQGSPSTPSKLLENDDIKSHYVEQGIDTFTRIKANMKSSEIVAICKFNIDKYNWRNKNQDLKDIVKMRDYLELWESTIKI